jgi:diacylglycerol kinase (ATP)
MANPHNLGLRRVLRATFFSLAGLRAAWLHEAAFRQECALCAVLVPAAFWVGSTAVERALLAGSCLLVLIVELLNSAIEATVDRIGSEHHLLAARAKDCGSAAVLVSLILLAACWGLIGWERFA